MTDADAFLDAIFARPDDDTPRLVYADWLDEHGQASYAEFIRLQCAIAPLMNSNPERLRLREREKRVWAELRKQWTEFLKVTGLRKDQYHRGFIRERVKVDPLAVADHADHWWPWHPMPQIDLYGVGPSWDRVLNADYLGRVPRVNVSVWPHSEPLPADSLLVLASRGSMQRTRTLDISSVYASPDALRRLTTADWLDRLDRFSLTIRLSGEAEVHDGDRPLFSSGSRPFLCMTCRRPNGDGSTVRNQILAFIEQNYERLSA